MMLMLDAIVMSISTRKSSSRRLGLFVTIGTAAAAAMSTRIAGRNGARRRITRVPRSRACPEQSGRLQEQDTDEDDVLDHGYPGHRNEHREHSLEEADHEATDQRAGRIAQSAEHDDDEAFELVGPT